MRGASFFLPHENPILERSVVVKNMIVLLYSKFGKSRL